MTGSSPFPPFERHFGHCIILWKVKNFTLAINNPGTTVLSNEFNISDKKVTTRWLMGIHIESENCLKMFLKRLRNEIDESFEVSWKVSILDRNGEEFFVSENEQCFKENTRCTFPLLSPAEILKRLSANEPNEVRMQCQIIVFMNRPYKMSSPDLAGLKSLFEDLSLMRETGYLYDITAIVGKESLKMHKAMICTRVDDFSKYSLCNRNQTFKINNKNTQAVKNVFAYLYSGDMKYIFNPPSISIYGYIRELDIKELRHSYPQEKVTMKTLIKAKRFDFRWTLSNFSHCQEPQDSEIYSADGMNSTWQLRIYPKGLKDPLRQEDICIKASVLSTLKSQDVFIDLRVVNEGRTLISRRMDGKIREGSELLVQFLKINGYMISKVLVNDTLDISFCVHEATGETHSVVTKTQPPVPFNLNNFNTCKILTTYMGNLQLDHEFSDIILKVQNQEFKAHKFILSGRSITFSQMLEKVKDNDLITLNNIHKHVFRTFLDFIYRGIMSDTSTQTLMALYDVAVHYKVNSLIELCLEQLKKNMDPENLCYILEFADKRHLAGLKTDVFQLIYNYCDYIGNTEGWRFLQNRNPQLVQDVIQFVTNNLRWEKNEQALEEFEELEIQSVDSKTSDHQPEN